MGLTPSSTPDLTRCYQSSNQSINWPFDYSITQQTKRSIKKEINERIHYPINQLEILAILSKTFRYVAQLIGEMLL